MTAHPGVGPPCDMPACEPGRAWPWPCAVPGRDVLYLGSLGFWVLGPADAGPRGQKQPGETCRGPEACAHECASGDASPPDGMGLRVCR